MRALLRGTSALALLASTACLPQDLAFRVDERVMIIEPRNREIVSLPVTVRWEVENFEVVQQPEAPRDGAGYFAVFVDQSPMPPGKTVAWLVKDDRSCDPSDGCPDAEYLRERGVYLSTDTQVLVEELPQRRDGRRERHTATVVLLDGAGRRIGESVFFVDFEVDRGEQL